MSGRKITASAPPTIRSNDPLGTALAIARMEDPLEPEGADLADRRPAEHRLVELRDVAETDGIAFA